MKRLGSTGDTIIEVLISIAVVSMIIGGAFTSANRSLNATQAAKERDQGIRLAETQIEQLRAALKNAADITAIAGFSHFCMNATTLVVISAAVDPEINNDPLNASVYPAGCTLNSGNTTYTGADPSIPYYVSVYHDTNPAGDQDLYTARVRWDRAGGNGREQVVVRYRVYSL